MKNYFNFNLTGKKFFPIWLLFMICYFIPYVSLVFLMQDAQSQSSNSLLILALFFVLIIVAFVLTFYIAKMVIEHVSFRNIPIVYKGTIGKYLGTIVLGFFLTIITLGIYTPWFIRNIHRFFVNNSSYNSENLRFNGKGGRLFLILLLTLMLPIILLVVVMAKYMITNPGQTTTFVFIQQFVMMVIMIPYMYLVYKWMVNISYKDYNISWDTNFLSSCGKIAFEMLLTIITLGIYLPLAWIRLYKYFSEKTVAASGERRLQFGYDIDQLNDFLFIWGQILLTIISLGIYYPWAMCKIGNRILGKTYLVEA